MKEYELKTTVAQLGVLEMISTPDIGMTDMTLLEVRTLVHDARLAHELLERVKFLERVAEQATEGADLGVLTGMEDNWVFVGDLCPESFRAPDLATYLRSRTPEIEGLHSIGWGEVGEHLRPASDAGQENK